MRTLSILPLLLLAPTSAPAAQQATRSAPILLETAFTAEPALDGPTTATERRLVRVRRELLGTAPTLALDLFDGERIVVEHTGSAATRAEGFVWRGAVRGAGDSDVVLAVSGEAVVGSIRLDDRLYRLSHAGADRQWLTLEDESRFGGCATEGGGFQGLPVEVEPQAAPERASAAPIVDVLVVYSTEAKDAVGGTSAMTALIDLAVTETNEAYLACGVTQRLRLVHTEEMLGYTEPSSFSSILNHLTSKNDGRLDEVHALRDQYGADAVVMICENGQYCGIAHLMTNVSASFESQAFSVVNYGCATGYYSFGHELGHNFGSHHDPANAGNAAYSYSYGYRTPNSQYRSIMAYAPGTRVKRFSSPNATWQGNVMGTASQDNARSMNNTGPTVAAWRAAVAQPSLLEATPLVAGGSATFVVSSATPQSQVLLGYSTTGGGPTASPYGTALLSPPIRLFATLVTGEGRSASHTTSVPLAAAGLTVWFQALDLGSGLLGNGLQLTVQ